MRRAADYLDYYQLVLKKFKQTCADVGFLDDYKASLEDCITGIRNALRESVNYNLMVCVCCDVENLWYCTMAGSSAKSTIAIK